MRQRQKVCTVESDSACANGTSEAPTVTTTKKAVSRPSHATGYTPSTKSLKRQSASDIETFKNNRDELRRAVVDLIELSNRTFPDIKQFPKRLKLPTTLKALTLFMEELDSWENFGAFDEQSIESSHAMMNNIDRLFGATQGKARKKLIIDKILLRSSRVITKGIEQIYKDTKSKRKPKERASSSALQEEEEHEEEEEEVTSAELMPFQKEMNENPLLRLPMMEEDDEEESDTDEQDDESYEEFDTMIFACPHCSGFDRFIGKKSLQLHCKELHNTEIEAEHDVIPGEGGLR